MQINGTLMDHYNEILTEIFDGVVDEIEEEYDLAVIIDILNGYTGDTCRLFDSTKLVAAPLCQMIIRWG